MSALAIVVFGCLAILGWLIATAPEGYETDEGFHYGPEPFEHGDSRFADSDRLAPSHTLHGEASSPSGGRDHG